MIEYASKKKTKCMYGLAYFRETITYSSLLPENFWNKRGIIPPKTIVSKYVLN